MNLLGRLWYELTRPRGPVRHRFYRLRRRSQRGIALLLVITSLMFMTVLVTEIAFAATVRLQLAAHSRDEVKAEALATTGVNIYRLVLVGSKAIGKALSNFVPPDMQVMLGITPGDALWQMIPFLNTEMMRFVFVTGGDQSDVEDAQASGAGLTDEQVAQSRRPAGLMDKNFLDFDGDFLAEVTDEDRKINVSTFTATNRADLENDPTAAKLYAMMSGVRTCPDLNGGILDMSATEAERDDLDKFFYDRNLDRWSLIGNLADWTDPDNLRLYDGGAEDSLYNTLERNPYLPKNAGFDTLDEIRLVDGWNRDDVWDKFGSDLTIFGRGKVNVNTADCAVLSALLKWGVQPTPNDYQVAVLLKAIQEQKALVSFGDPQQFVALLQQQPGVVSIDPKLKNAITTESRVFRVTSSGAVGDTTVTIDAIIDFSSSQTGKIVYWRIR